MSVKKGEKKNCAEFEKELLAERELSGKRLEQLKYLHADFDNFRKIAEKQNSEVVKRANEQLVSQILPVLDDFDAVLARSKDAASESVHKKLINVLMERGLATIGAKGMFDHNLHEAICCGKSDKEDGTIIEELQKGYTLNGRVIRHSKVKVAKND
ncbi:MAG: nucleotide exchange factor GrpE [Candidatus Altiarchaeales archaeon IMC4]|nr:MAG: nucleotide exchange factor GrpE [Candidatus Altiarchaeales archaeon IMC4]